MPAFASEITKCLILFADIIDSSKYSAVLGSKEYVERMLKFQKLFNDLAVDYFDSAPEYRAAYKFIRVYGDEGAIFLVAPKIAPQDIMYHAVQFAYELKARMEMKFFEIDPAYTVPKVISVGVGIHYGEVAVVVEDGGVEKVSSAQDVGSIKKVEGFSINYAKRVESGSRNGKYSNIFLSPEAASLLRTKTIM